MERAFLENLEGCQVFTPKIYFKNKASWELTQVGRISFLVLWVLPGLTGLLNANTHIYNGTRPKGFWHISACINLMMLFRPPLFDIEEAVKLQTDQLCRRSSKLIQVCKSNDGIWWHSVSTSSFMQKGIGVLPVVCSMGTCVTSCSGGWWFILQSILSKFETSIWRWVREKGKF